MPVFNNRTPQYAEQVEGGIGRMQRDRLLEGDQLGGICSYVAQISLEPGCSIGIHQHVGDSEMYFITAGTATYTENDVEYRVEKGDVLYCPDGSFHGILNSGEDMLSFVAVIQNANSDLTTAIQHYSRIYNGSDNSGPTWLFHVGALLYPLRSTYDF